MSTVLFIARKECLNSAGMSSTIFDAYTMRPDTLKSTEWNAEFYKSFFEKTHIIAALILQATRTHLSAFFATKGTFYAKKRGIFAVIGKKFGNLTDTSHPNTHERLTERGTCG